MMSPTKKTFSRTETERSLFKRQKTKPMTNNTCPITTRETTLCSEKRREKRKVNPIISTGITKERGHCVFFARKRKRIPINISTPYTLTLPYSHTLPSKSCCEKIHRVCQGKRKRIRYDNFLANICRFIELPHIPCAMFHHTERVGHFREILIRGLS